MLFVNGELRIIYMGADESIIKKVDEAPFKTLPLRNE